MDKKVGIGFPYTPPSESEIILDLADDLLEAAETKPQYDSAIAITCVAWHLATVNSAEYAKSLERGLNKIDDQLHQKATLKIINALVKKRIVFILTSIELFLIMI